MNTIYEEMWFKDASRTAKLTVPEFRNTIFDYFKQCENETKKFRSTFYECVENNIASKRSKP